MNVTVSICAFSLARWELLLASVESVLPQLTGDDECLLVIDHNDRLTELAQAQFAALPRVRVVASTHQPGISGVRNMAVEHARGDAVAFLDDDAAANPGWLERIRQALAEPDVYGVGTAALPAWPAGSRPPWFPPEFDWVVGCTYLGMPTAPAQVRNVIGAAMAFRREAFAMAGTFSPAVGRVGNAATGCEETEFCIRIARLKPGARIMYLPDVAVLHQVAPERASVRYFLRRCRGEGRSKAWVARLAGAAQGLSSERAYVASVLPHGLLREVGRGLRGRGSGWLAALLIILGVASTGYGFVLARLASGRKGPLLTPGV